MDEQIRGVLGEQLLGELQAIRELVSEVPAIKATVEDLKADMADVKGRLTSVEIVLTEHSADLKEIKHFVGSHEERLVALESQAT